MKRKGIMLAALFLLISIGLSMPALAGWQKDNVGWWWQKDDGTYYKEQIVTIGGEKYGFNESGYMYENIWLKGSSGKWYYATGSGALAKDTWIGDYYLGSDCTMKTNSWIGEYYVGEDGMWVPGMKKEGGGTSGQFRRDWIYGSYSNEQQSGFSKTHRVDLEVMMGPDGEDALFRFGLYDIAGTGYSLYDKDNPNGDELYAYTSDNRQFWGRSRIRESNQEYLITYDGEDTIRIYWMPTTWYSGQYLEFKKTEDMHGGGVG